MKKTKRKLSLVLSVIMLSQTIGINSVSASVPNNDISKSTSYAVSSNYSAETVNDYSKHWAAVTIEKLINADIITGYTDGSVKPDNKISRAEFVTLVNKLFGYTEKASINFSDVKSSAWYANQFAIAKKAGYVSGDNYGHANPTDNITRAEVCSIIARALNLDNVSTTAFTDNSDIPIWAKGYIGALFEADIISGYPDGSFGARRNITRAEAFTIINNTIEYDINSTNNMNNYDKEDKLKGSNSHKKQETIEETNTEESTETTTKKKISSSSGGSSGGGSSSKNSNTETTTENSDNSVLNATLSDDELDKIEDVDDKIDELILNASFKNETPENRKSQVLTLLNTLENQGLIKSGTIKYNEVSGIYEFTYISDVQGGVMIKAFSEDLNGIAKINNTSDTEKFTYHDNTELKLYANNSSLGGDAIIFNGFENIPYRRNFYNELEETWENLGLNTTVDVDVTVEDLMTFGLYDMVILSMHGSFYNNSPILCTNGTVNKDTNKDYKDDLRAKNIVKLSSSSGKYYGIYPKFFDSHYTSNSVKTQFLFSETCMFMGRRGDVDESFPNSFIKIGIDTVVGYHNSVGADYSRNVMALMVEEMLGGTRAISALADAKRVYGDNDNIEASSFIEQVLWDGKFKAFPCFRGDGTTTLISLKSDQAISGYIESDSGEKIHGARINFIRNNTTIKSTESSENGTFDLWLPVGIYDVEVLKEGYFAKRISNIELERGLWYTFLDGITITKSDIFIPVTVSGKVVDASDGITPIKNAKIDIYSNDNSFTYSQNIDENGQFTLFVNKGKYNKILISAPGYISMKYDDVELTENATYLETLLFLNENQNSNACSAHIKVTNSTTGQTINGASIKIRQNWNAHNGDYYNNATYSTDSNGIANCNLPAGYYTAEITLDGYTTSYCNIISSTYSRTHIASLNPLMPEGNLRVVLTWDRSVSDLDSHFAGPRSNNSIFHVYFNAKHAYDNSEEVANLDVDDTNYEGPETVTLLKQIDGTYKYSVYNYSGGGDSVLPNSHAKVEVYKGETLWYVFNVPTNQSGRVWNVFELSGTILTPINVISNNYDSITNIGSFSLHSLDLYEVEEKYETEIVNDEVASGNAIEFDTEENNLPLRSDDRKEQKFAFSDTYIDEKTKFAF